MVRRTVLLTSVLVTLTHGVAWGCECLGDLRPLDEALADHPLVVYGRVRSVYRPALGCDRPVGNPFRVRLEVLEGFAGADAGDSVVVHTHPSDKGCGVPFDHGEQWLVFAYGEDRWVDGCGPTDRMGPEDPRLDELRSLTE